MAERTYEGDGIEVLWDSSRCIHTARCIRALPAVFDPGRRPWVEPGGESADRIAEAVERCPTGALRYVRTDTGPQERPEQPTRAIPAPRGPLIVRGALRVEAPNGGELAQEGRLALCRCGATANPPYCDNSHRAIEFDPPAPTPVGEEDSGRRDGDNPDGALVLTVVVPEPNGPLSLHGDIRLETPDGELIRHANTMTLCRCGQSANKPFCDGSHSDVGFTSADPVVEPEADPEANTPAEIEANPQVDC